MDDKPRNLRAMLSEAKDTSELMVDLAYAALYFGDPDMAEEVVELEETISRLVHEMQSVAVLAARSPRDAEAMASVFQVINAIERISNAAVDISRIVTHRLGIPSASWPTCRRPRRSPTGCGCGTARRWPTAAWPTSSCRPRSACRWSPS